MNLRNICTFVIPFRIDGKERQRNLDFVLNWLAPLKSKILLLEADKQSRVDKLCFPENVEYIFIEDKNPIFHRTRYINILLKQAQTDIVSVWDTDVVTTYQQIEEAVSNIQAGCTMSFPYDGKVIMLSQENTERFVKSKDIQKLERENYPPIFKRPSCGGAYFVNRLGYLALGGDNERFVGWGPEDAERLRRTQIMGHLVKWITAGKIYHLYHPINDNSHFFNEDLGIEMRREFVKVCSMNREELSEYIRVMNK